MLCASLFLLISARNGNLVLDKEWTNMAVPQGAKVWSKKVFLFLDV